MASGRVNANPQRRDPVPLGNADPARPARLIAELIDAADRPITFPASKLPHEAARRLLETLGVTIVDDGVPLKRTVDAAPKTRVRRRPRPDGVRRAVWDAMERRRARGLEPDELELEVALAWADEAA